MTLEKEKTDPSHLLKYLLANRTYGTFGFAHNTSLRLAKSQEPFLSHYLEEEFRGEPYIEGAVYQFLNDRVK